MWFFREHWFVTGDVAVGQIAGSAAHSPITQKATNTVVGPHRPCIANSPSASPEPR
ncbi:MipA/OmpV family protein [Cupriavidus sp. CuC1]|uniref:MipA/OmpV family protein n=1 Tax=Cupriavidus sp. CuC1 TaxID=3373131 RepID=UPI0037D195A8